MPSTDSGASTLWSSLFNSTDDPRIFHIFQNLWTVLTPFRNSLITSLQVALKIPLSDGEIPSSVQVFFWLEIIVRMLKKTDITPSLFIPELRDVTDLQSLYIFFREPQASDYRDIMEDNENSDKINDLCADWGFLEQTREVPLKGQKVLESKEATLQQIIDSCGIE